MPNIRITYRLSQDGQRADIMEGGDGKSCQEIALERGHESFARAIRIAEIKPDGSGSIASKKAWNKIPSISELIDEAEFDAETKRISRYKESEKARRETRKVLEERRTRPDLKYNGSPCGYFPAKVPDWPNNRDKDISASDEAKSWLGELAAENEASRLAWIKDAEESAIRRAKAEVERQVLDREREEAARKAESERRAILGLKDGEIDLQVVGGCLATVPIWCDHKRGNNWMAIISPNPGCPGGLDRSFAARGRGELRYVLPWIKPGTAIEFGADYRSYSGNRSTHRWHGYLVRIDPEYIVLMQCDGGNEAITMGQEHARKEG